MESIDMELPPYFERPEVTLIDDHNFESFLGLDAVAISFAEGGAMGSPGLVEIVTRNGKWYDTNYAFGTIYITNLFQVIPILGEYDRGAFDHSSSVEGWRLYDLGAGNHLFIKAEIAEEFDKLISDVTRPVHLYRRWPFAVDNILKHL